MPTLMTEEQLARVLKGTRVVVYVSEPFGFEYPAPEDGGVSTEVSTEVSAGAHQEVPGLEARVAEVRIGDDGPPAVASVIRLELETPFVSAEGVRVTHLLARLRHESRMGLVEQLATGEHVSANLSYADQVPEDKRIPNRIPKLVGGIDLAR